MPWADLTCLEDKPTHEQIVLILQRALVLVGSASHSISVERRKTAWARINPTLKSLANEEYDRQEGNLFGPGFLEKASRKIEAEKAIAKVTGNALGSHKRPYEEDPSDLCRFLSNGASAKYGSKGKQH